MSSIVLGTKQVICRIVLEKDAVELPGDILVSSDSISGQNTVLETCVMTVSPLI